MSSKLTENLKSFRLLHGFTQKQLAEKIECAPSTISSWENGEASPNGDFIYKLCEVFNTCPDVLFGFKPIEDLEKLMVDRDVAIKQLEEIKKQRLELENRIQAYARLLNR